MKRVKDGIYYKVFQVWGKGLEGPHSQNTQLQKAGDVLRVVGKLKACRNGIHAIASRKIADIDVWLSFNVFKRGSQQLWKVRLTTVYAVSSKVIARQCEMLSQIKPRSPEGRRILRSAQNNGYY